MKLINSVIFVISYTLFFVGLGLFLFATFIYSKLNKNYNASDT